MKILHVIPSVAPVRGGPGRAALEMVKVLREFGVDAEIATTNDNGPNLLSVPLGQRIEYHEAPVWFFPRFSPKITPVRDFAFSKKLTLWLWKHISEYDLLHIHAIFSYPSTIAMTLARLRKVPYIVRPLGQLCEWSLRQNAWRKQIYLTLIERANLDQSMALHFTSETEARETSKTGVKVPGFILPHGIFMPHPLPNARTRLRRWLQVSDDEPVILYMSRLHPKKGLEYLIPALGKLRSRQRFTFALAGSGPPQYETEIEALLRRYEIHDRTRRFGFVEGEKKNLLLQGSDLFVLTSHSENLGLSVLEAFAAGLPALVTPEIALASTVKEHRLGWVTELEIPAIASALQNSLDHLEEARKMGESAQELVRRKYGWSHIITNLVTVYERILKKESLPALA